MFALTVHQPYAHFLATGRKRVENRDWPPPANLVGQWIAIHAGRETKHYADDAAMIQAELGLDVPPLEDVATGAVIAVAVLDRVVTTEHDAGYDEWYSGPYGWFLRDVVKIAPVRCRGFQKLWRLRPVDLALVRERYRAAAQGKALAHG